MVQHKKNHGAWCCGRDSVRSRAGNTFRALSELATEPPCNGTAHRHRGADLLRMARRNIPSTWTSLAIFQFFFRSFSAWPSRRLKRLSRIGSFSCARPTLLAGDRLGCVSPARLFPELVINVWDAQPSRLDPSAICDRLGANDPYLHGGRVGFLRFVQ